MKSAKNAVRTNTKNRIKARGKYGKKIIKIRTGYYKNPIKLREKYDFETEG
jgi:hypothetical protein